MSLSLALKAKTTAKLADPLAHYVPASRAAERLVEFVNRRIETHWRAANFGGKTYGGGALGVALAQMRKVLGGQAVPRFDRPTRGAVLSRTYRQQVDSVQAAYRYWLGDWPHEIGWLNRALGYVGSIAVRPIDWPNDDPETWSRIAFISQETPDAVLGARWDWVHADEPPIEKVWREVRKNAAYRWITETPLDRTEWEWLAKDFALAHDTPHSGRVEIVSSLYDNLACPPDRRAELEAAYEGDPLKKARLWGEYCDISGASIWDAAARMGLEEMLRDCREPRMVDTWLRATVRSEGRIVPLEIYEGPDEAEEYYLCVDPSGGVSGEGLDPCAMHVYARRRPRMVARFRGYLPAQSLGHLAAKTGRVYRNAVADVETQGGWGEAVLVGLHEEGYGRLAVDDREVRAGKSERKLGFRTSRVTKGLYLAAAQESAASRSIEVPSRDAVKSMMGAKFDPKGNVVFDDGTHGEDLILYGRAAHWMGTNPPMKLLSGDPSEAVLQGIRDRYMRLSTPDEAQVRRQRPDLFA